jgi:phosphoglycolate phosphatase-like HAD superfamily hydrolase
MSAIKTAPKAIIFDIDGTLADSYNLAFDATNTVLRNNGHQETTPDEYHQGTR